MAAELRFFCANRDNQWPIHSQRFDCRSARHRQPDNLESLPAKVVGPGLMPWMVKRNFPLPGFIPARGGITPCPLGAQPQQSQKLGQIDQAFGLTPFRQGEFFTAILSIEQILQALINPSWQGEAVDIVRHFELERQIGGSNL